MKSQIISAHKKADQGFLLPEAMIAFSLMTLFLVSALALSSTMEKLRVQAIHHLERLEYSIANISSTTLYIEKPYGNDTREISIDPVTLLFSDYQNGWGRGGCDPRLSYDPAKVTLYAQGTDLGTGNISTDLEVRNNIAYITADGGSASSPDLFIVDMRNATTSAILSSLNTGPGLAALEVAGHYVYAANLSTTNQLQVIDIQNRASPVLVAKLKLPLPQASSTAPLASSIFYNKGLIYLGTEKWEGNEFSIIDASTPASPRYLGGFKTNTLVTDIYVRDGIAYIGASDIGQMRILDVHDPSVITEITEYSPSGWATQQGKVVSYFEGKISLGRTTGGFNVIGNHEIFLFATTTPIILKNSHDIPGGVYGLIERPSGIYLATKSPGHEFQIWDNSLSQLVYEKALGFLPETLTCDGKMLYFATGNQRGIAVLRLN